MAPQIFLVPITGVIADTYGRTRPLAAGLVLFGVAGAAIALTSNLRVALALRLLPGVGASGINPIIITIIGETYAGAREATGQGLRFTSSGLSGTVFPLISGSIFAFGWQYPFLLYALAIPAALVVAAYLEEPTRTDASRRSSSDGGAPRRRPRRRRRQRRWAREA